MLVHKQCTTPKLTRSLAMDITNDEKAPETLPLGEHGCLPEPPHPPDPPPDSNLPPPHPGWEKTRLSGESFSRTSIVPSVHLTQSVLMTDS